MNNIASFSTSVWPMAYSESLACRVRELLERTPYITEKKMFGGLGILYLGHLLVGVRHDSLILRIGPDQAAIALNEPGVSVFNVTGKPMKGWVMVREACLNDDDELLAWLRRAIAFVDCLPAR